MFRCEDVAAQLQLDAQVGFAGFNAWAHLCRSNTGWISHFGVPPLFTGSDRY